MRGGSKVWSGEVYYGEAARAIRLPKLEHERFGAKPVFLAPRCAFRRVFADGEALVRAEVGIIGRELRSMVDSQALNIVSSLLGFQVEVQQRGRAAIACPFQNIGQSLAPLYLYATTPRSHHLDSLRAVQAGEPMIIVEHEDEISFRGRHIRTVGPPLEKKVYFAWGTSRGNTVGVWFLNRVELGATLTRELRLCLSRLHTERQVLKIVLGLIAAKQIRYVSHTESGENLERYLNEATRVISRDHFGSVNQKPLLEMINSCDNLVSEDERIVILEELDRVRRQVLKKVDAQMVPAASLSPPAITFQNVETVVFGRSGVTVERKETVEKQYNVNTSGQGNLVNIAEYMVGVTNTVQQNIQDAKVGSDAKELVTELMRRIADLSPTIDPAVAEQMGDDVKALSEQMKKVNPRREWYQLSLKGLKEAAEALGEVGKPILETVLKLAPMLVSGSPT